LALNYRTQARCSVTDWVGNIIPVEQNSHCLATAVVYRVITQYQLVYSYLFGGEYMSHYHIECYLFCLTPHTFSCKVCWLICCLYPSYLPLALVSSRRGMFKLCSEPLLKYVPSFWDLKPTAPVAQDTKGKIRREPDDTENAQSGYQQPLNTPHIFKEYLTNSEIKTNTLLI
jgi:hypothetical protein